MEVVGRHAMLFDDDATSAFVNSREALVEWNSLLIDRYDVRHLLLSPPLVKNNRRLSSSSSEEDEDESELDLIRFQDLPPPSADDDDDDDVPRLQENSGAQPADGNIYRAVSFSYGNTNISFESKNSDVPGFLPPFPVPESLHQSLPHTEKLHQIMARTAIFVSEHGGQSEIVLRVKQGNNPTFGFLMPDHHLHAYFRFLVDHPEVLKSNNSKPEEFQKADREKQTGAAGEALSLLGSVYGTGEDEDGAVQIVSETTDNEPGYAFDSTSGTLGHGSGQAVSSGYSAGLDLTAPKHSHPVDKEKGSWSKKIHSVGTVASSTVLGKKKQENVFESLPSSLHKLRASAPPSASNIEPVILEPPSEIKRMMDKIIEFILKNGKDFEAVLIEQDRTNGRFPFLLPSNQYHSYYLKNLREAQESKQVGKSSTARTDDSARHVSGKISSFSKDKNTLSNGSASQDLPYDPERKEKFKMVITGSKKDTQDTAPKPTQQQCGMSVDAVAAVLQAATRGLRNPKLDIPMKSSLGDSIQGVGSDGNPASSFVTLSFSPQMRSSTSKPTSKDEPSVSIPVELSRSVGLPKEASGVDDVSVAKAIAKTAALASASEADSSEACLTKEQKQKAERLKRAKMFAAIIKSGAVPQTNELLPRLSAEPPDSVISGLAGSGCKTEVKDGFLNVLGSSNLSDGGIIDIMAREREGSSIPADVDNSDRREKYRKMESEDDYKERRSRKRHHSRSSRVEDDEEEEERNPKHSRKKHHSHHSSHHSKGEHRHRKRHSSSKDRESRHRHKYHSSSEDDDHHKSRSYKHHRLSHSGRKAESKDDSGGNSFHESNTARSGKSASRESSLDLINDRWEGSTPSVEAQPSDDLRAKVRAMLLATM